MFENHKKVSFNITSEASYVYILSEQKFIKNVKNGQFGRVFENLKLGVKLKLKLRLFLKVFNHCDPIIIIILKDDHLISEEKMSLF